MVDNVKVKKPFYKQWWFVLISIAIVTGIIVNMFNEDEMANNNTIAAEKETIDIAKSKEDTSKKEVETEVIETDVVKPLIDTSIFEYASKVDVTNALDINNHVTSKVFIDEDANPGMAVQDIIKQTFDYIQQEDLKDAKTITILVTQNDKKIAQFTVQKDQFIPNENEPMIKIVLDASEIEHMSAEVKSFGETMELW